MGAHISIPMYQRTIPQRYRLVAQRCRSCGSIQFPPKGVCGHCSRSFEFDDVTLGGRGTVDAITLIHPAGAPPEFATQSAMRGRYAVAIITLEEGPKIAAQLTNATHVRIGMPVEAVFRRIYVDEGVIRYGLKFRPLNRDVQGAPT
jgi:uncharacterized OB-fold protein